jgi:hypothetical protein
MARSQIYIANAKPLGLCNTDAGVAEQPHDDPVVMGALDVEECAVLVGRRKSLGR